MEEKINARLIIEAQGKPADYVRKRLEEHIAKMKQIQGAEIYETKFDEVKELEKGLFSGLVDVGVYAKDFETLAALVVGFGPSALVILEPDKIEITARELQNTMNDIASLIHHMAQSNLDLRVKTFLAQMEKKNASQKDKEQ